MPVSINMPQRQASPLEGIAAALNVVRNVYGIKADSAALEKAKRDEEMRSAQFDMQKQEFQRQQANAARKDAGEMTAQEFAGIADKFAPAKDSDRGAIKFQVRSGAGLTEYVLKPRHGEANGLDGFIKQMTAQKLQNELAGVRPPQQLPAGQAETIGGANSSYKAVDDVNTILSDAQDISGPAAGLLSKGAAYFQVGERGKRAATAEAQLKSRAQTIGKYLEGGKLTDSDIGRYKEMLPSLTDTSEVAQAKVENIKRLIAQKQNEEKAAMAGAGYNVANIPSVQTPGIPSNKAKAPGSSDLVTDAKASSGQEDVRVVNGTAYKRVNGGWQRM